MDKKSLLVGMGIGGALVISGIALGGMAQPGVAAQDATFNRIIAKEIMIVGPDGDRRMLITGSRDNGRRMEMNMYTALGEVNGEYYMDEKGDTYFITDVQRTHEVQIVNFNNQKVAHLKTAEDHGELMIFNQSGKRIARVGGVFRGGGSIYVMNHDRLVAGMTTNAVSGIIQTRRVMDGKLQFNVMSDQAGATVQVYDANGAQKPLVPPATVSAPAQK